MGEQLMTSWLIVHTPDGPHVWNLGEPDDATREDLILRAKVAVGFPAGDQWLADLQRWNCMLSGGEPHPKLTARATVHTLAELDAIGQGDLQSYRDRCHEACRTAQLEAARLAIAGLDDIQRDALRTELGSASAELNPAAISAPAQPVPRSSPGGGS